MSATAMRQTLASGGRWLRLLGCGLALLLQGSMAGATFHLWQIAEIHSNASGSVQYVMLQTAIGGQQFVGGHQIAAAQGTNLRSYTFDKDLPGDSAGRTFLIGTQGFAALGLVTPDFVVPNGFLFTPGGKLDFVGADAMTYGALPADGVYALDRAGNKVVAMPRNFAGAAKSIADCLFDWAERTYPQYFPPAQAASASFAPYFYRHYAATANYLAVSAADGHVWVLGPVSGNALLDVGPSVDFLGTAGCS